MVKYSSYPEQIDSDLELPRIDDNVTEIGGVAINSLRDAIFSIENAIGTNPQGNLADFVTRVNRVIDANGFIKTSALSQRGLITLPISDVHIANNAGIKESKLDLDFGTSILNSKITTNFTDIDLLRSSLNEFVTRTLLRFVEPTTIFENFAQLADAIITIRKDLDGYAAVHDADGYTADGYITFFTGETGVAGDNDLFWDRANNRLGVGTSSPTSRLQVSKDLSTLVYPLGNDGYDGYIYLGNGYGYVTIGCVDSNLCAFHTDLDDYYFNKGVSIDGNIETFDQDMSLAPAGTIRATLDIDGNLGIGTESPSEKLDVVGNVTTSGNLSVSGDMSEVTNIYASSNISIGGDIINDDLTETFQVIRQALDGYGVENVGQTSGFTGADGYIAFFTGNERIAGDNDLYWDRENNRLSVGGDTSPISPLTVGDGTNISPSGTGAGQFSIIGKDYTSYITMDATATYFGHNSSIRKLILQTDESSRLTIDGIGNVGIGTTTPGSNLHVHNNDAGGTAVPDSNAILTLENSTSGHLQFLVPNNATSFILFGNEDDNDISSISYNHQSNVMIFKTETLNRVQIGDNANLSGARLHIGVTASDTAGAGDLTFNIGITELFTWRISASSGVLNLDHQAWSPAVWNTALTLHRNSGNIGIGGIGGINSKLGINGNVSIGGNYYTTNAPTNGLLVEGRVGIGGNTASYPLHVVYDPGNFTADDIICIDSDNEGISSGGYLRFQNQHVSARVGMVNSGTLDSDLVFETTTNGSDLVEHMRIADNGFVGIGTTDPLSKLSVFGGDDLSPNANGTGYIELRNNVYSGYITLDGTAMYIGHNSGSRKFILQTNETDRVTIDKVGNVGLGVSPAGARLHIETTDSDTAGAGDLTFNAGSIELFTWRISADNGVLCLDRSWGVGTWYENALCIKRIDGRVGLGITAPDSLLHIHNGDAGDVTAGGNTLLTLENDTNAYLSFLTTDSNTAGLIFGEGTTPDSNKASILYDHSSNLLRFLANYGADTLTIGNNVGTYTSHWIVDTNGLKIGHNSSNKDIQFQTNSDTKMWISSGGNVGIGTTTPGSNLHVHNNDAGGTAVPDSNAILTLENSTSGHLQFLVPNNATSFILFGNEDDNDISSISYNHQSNVMIFKTETLNRVQIGDNANLSGARLHIGVTTSDTAGAGDLTFNAGSTELFTWRIGDSNGVLNLDHQVWSPAASWNTALTVRRHSGNIGIGGIGVISSKLGVNGNVSIGSNYYTTNAPTDGLLVKGRVGIATISPDSRLEVNGTVHVSGYDSSVNSWGKSVLLGVNKNVYWNGASEGETWGWGIGRTSDEFLRIFCVDADSGTGNDLRYSVMIEGGAPTNSLHIDTNGNVGLGVSPAGARLHIETTASDTAGAGDLTFNAGSTELFTWRISADNGVLCLDRSWGVGTWYENALCIKRIDGRVGLGITAPDSLLHIHNATAGDVTAGGNTLLTLENDTNAYLSFLTTDSNTAGLIFGEGTTPDSNKASILYDHSSNLLRFLANNHSVDTLTIGNNVGTYTSHWIVDTNGLKIGHNSSNKDIQFQTNSDTKMWISSGGNVGIGTDSPDSKLEVNGTIHISSFDSSVNTWGKALVLDINNNIYWPGLSLGETWGWGIGRTADDILRIFCVDADSGTGNDLRFPVMIEGGAPTNSLFIDSAGNVGIGIITPLSQLGVNGNVAIGSYSGSSAPTNGLAVSGNVNIGTNSGTSALNVENNSSAHTAYFYNASTSTASHALGLQCGADDQSGATYRYIECFDGDGDAVGGLQNNSSGTFQVFDISDERLKTKIQSSKIDALGIITNLPVSEFAFKKSPDNINRAGFVAQYVQNIFPEMVSKPVNENDIYTVSASSLIPILVKAIQEQHSKVELLEDKIKKLEALIVNGNN